MMDDQLESQPLLGDKQEMTTKVRLHNLCCEMELRLVAKALDGKAGLVRYKVNMLGRVVEVRHVPSVLTVGAIIASLNEMNLGASVKEAGTMGEEVSPEAACRRDVAKLRDLYLLLSESILFLWYLASGGASRWALWVAIIIGGSDLAWNVGSRAMHGVFSPDMQTLMLIAITGASILGNTSEAVVMLWLISMSHLAEHSVLAYARAKVEGCGESLPMSATLAATGEDIKVSELKKGDRIVVRAGEAIPADGVVVQHSGHVDESAVTGEALPKKKTLKSEVIAGTLVQDGLLIIQATAAAEDSTASVIQDMVESAASSKSPVDASIDVFAGYYTTVVLLLAAGIASYPLYGATDAPVSAYLHRALVLIVLGCPCALVTAGPIVTTCGVAANAGRGVLIKTADALEALASLDTICFDKTGTLTDGKFRVVDKWERPGAHEMDRKRVVSLETKSAHPLAAAVVNSFAGCMTEAVEELGVKLSLPEIEDVSVIEGKGMRCVSGGKKVIVGSKKLLTTVDAPVKEFIDRNNEATLVFGMVDDVVVSAFALFDSPREVVGKMVEGLEELGVEAELLSGDRSAVVKVVAAKLGIHRARGDLLPHDKVAAVQGLQNRSVVAMVGDGINDAPALSAANVGWAMGAGGTALAAKSAAVVGVNDDLSMIPVTIKHARICKAIIKQNIAISILPKVAVALSALSGYFTPPLWIAVMADSGCLLLVLLNGTRVFAQP